MQTADLSCLDVAFKKTLQADLFGDYKRGDHVDSWVTCGNWRYTRGVPIHTLKQTAWSNLCMFCSYRVVRNLTQCYCHIIRNIIQGYVTCKLIQLCMLILTMGIVSNDDEIGICWSKAQTSVCSKSLILGSFSSLGSKQRTIVLPLLESTNKNMNLKIKVIK